MKKDQELFNTREREKKRISFNNKLKRFAYLIMTYSSLIPILTPLVMIEVVLDGYTRKNHSLENACCCPPSVLTCTHSESGLKSRHMCGSKQRDEVLLESELCHTVDTEYTSNGKALK